MTGERLGQAGWLGPSKGERKLLGRGTIHQFLWRRSRAVSNAKKELGNPGAIRNRSALSEVVQAGFELERIAVTQRVIGCYCASARCV